MDAGIRAADADRELVVAALQTHVGAGRLTLEEFSERSAAAYRARTLGELDGLTHDLPVDPPAPPDPPALSGAARRWLVPVLTVLALLIVGALLALAGPAAAMMGHAGAGC